MMIQDRDIEIINYVEEYGATIQQVADLFFNGSYVTAKKRLKKLQDEKFLKGKRHPVLNKKVYYKRRMPSYHALAIQDVCIQNRNVIQSYKREAKLDKHQVDALIVTKGNHVVILEIDLFNKTKKEKIEAVNQYVRNKLQQEPYFMILNRSDLQSRIAKRLPTG